jgi:transposase
MPPGYVKAYVKRNKNDAADAEADPRGGNASLDAVRAGKGTEQSVLVPHRARGLLVRQRTMLVNALRAHMAEFRMIAPQGLRHVEILTKTIAHKQERLPEFARSILQTIADQLNSPIAGPGRSP